ncbi:MAG TPA: lipoate-protein ligase B, partial [Segetibacter sp.]
MKKQVYYKDLGHNRQYKEVWDLQENLLQENVRIKSEFKNQPPTTNHELQTTNHLLFVEHNPVYTLGKSGEINHVLINEEERTKKGIEFYKINRGGDIT